MTGECHSNNLLDLGEGGLSYHEWVVRFEHSSLRPALQRETVCKIGTTYFWLQLCVLWT